MLFNLANLPEIANLPKISAVALILFFVPPVRRLFEGGAYSRAVLI